MFEYSVGLGQGGGRIARAFKEGFPDLPTVYMNLAGVDFAGIPGMSERNRLVFEQGGTGRDPRFGEKIVRSKFKRVISFLDRPTFKRSNYVLVTVGGGGGAGTGFLFPMIDYLISLGKHVFLVYTLPEKREGLPTKPNALESLDRLVAEYVQKHKISLLLVDNDYCEQQYGRDQNYWANVNTGIVTSVKRFYVLTQLESYQRTGMVDMSAGYKALDLNDLRRVMFAKNGYLDLRRMSFEGPVDEEGGLARAIRESGLLFDGMDLRTTKQYAVSVSIPMSWKKFSYTAKFVEDVFAAISKATRHAPVVIRTSYYNARSNSVQVHMLASGLARSKAIDRMIRGTVKDQERLANRGDAERLDIKSVVNNSRKYE